MDLKYMIWNYQGKRLHFTWSRKIWSYKIMNSMLQTFNALDITTVFSYLYIYIYITYKLPVQCISV